MQKHLLCACFSLQAALKLLALDNPVYQLYHVGRVDAEKDDQPEVLSKIPKRELFLHFAQFALFERRPEKIIKIEL